MTPTIINDDSSIADFRAMLAEPVADPTAEIEASETAKAATPEAATETAETKQEPEEKDEPLPKGVEKRIAAEVARQAKLDRQIAEAVSTTKAKEAELAKLTGKSGSEPATTTAPVKDAKPTKPAFAEFKEADGPVWPRYQEALAKYETEHESWLIAETERRTEAKFTERQQQQAAQVRWDEAVKTHGAEFPKLMEQAQGIAPEGLQKAISALDDWSAVAVHLAKNPAQLKDLASVFEANPYKAIATLGRIEASLKTAPKAAEPLPNPPSTVGGGASASAGAFDIENASMSALRKHVAKVRAG